MRTSALFGSNNFRFLNLGCVCTDKDGFGSADRGSIFRDFVRTSFMDAP